MKEPCVDCGKLKKVGAKWTDGLCGTCRSYQRRLSTTPTRKRGRSEQVLPPDAQVEHEKRIALYTQRAALRLPLFRHVDTTDLERAALLAQEIIHEDRSVEVEAG